MSTLKPLKSSMSRVFLIEGRARVDHPPNYQGRMRVGGIDQDFGDVNPIYAPDPTRFGKFEEVDEVRSEPGRATSSLSGLYSRDTMSELLRLARKGCSVDVQAHIGECTDPSVFNRFSKVVILEDVFLTNASVEDLGVIDAGDNSAVNEEAQISASDWYEVLPTSFGVKAASVVTNEVIDVVVCDQIGCGDCEDESDGCQRVYAISIAAGGSPSTPADILFSTDSGATWSAHDIETLGVAENPDSIECLGDYVVVFSNDSVSHHYALKSEIDAGTDPVFTEQTGGYVGAPTGAFSIDQQIFVVGDNGYIYKLTDPTNPITVIDAGSATVDGLNKVHALSANNAVAVGDNGAIVYTENGVSWSKTTSSCVGYGVDLTAIWMFSASVWFVGSNTGYLYYTTNKGDTWTEIEFPGYGSGVVRDIFFSTDSVGWLSHDTSTPAGRILRTLDGGYSWYVTPQGSANIPANDRITALAGCQIDPNRVFAVGLADDATDGIVIVGAGA